MCLRAGACTVVNPNDLLVTCSQSCQASKVERVASFRFLQALSHQANLLTSGRIRDLDFFSTPDGVRLSPVKPGQTRFLRRENNRLRAYHRLPDGEELPLLPEERNWWVQCPLLVLQLDQGPTCTAASAQLEFDLSCFMCKAASFLRIKIHNMVGLTTT